MNQQDSVYYTSRTDKPRRMDAPPQRDKEADLDKRDWRNGWSKRHRIRCRQCGGLIHERGKHFRPEQVDGLKRKREREAVRAAACGYEAGQDTPGAR